MVNFNLHLKATHTYASLAPTWIIDYRPVWYYFEGTTTYHGVIAIGNPFLWWLATLSLVAAVVLALLRRSYALLPAAAIIVVLYVPWFLTTRTSFLYYMTPVAPFMAILVAPRRSACSPAACVPRRGWLAAGAARARRGRPLAARRHRRRLAVLDAARAAPATRSAGSGVAVGVLAGARGRCIFLLSPRMRRYRPWMAMVVAGLVIGIVVAFIPIVLALPISPTYFSHIMWFPSWI